MAQFDNLALDHQLCVALNKATRAINACYRPQLAEIGFTYSQYAVMLVLWERGTATLGEIGETLRLDSGTLSPLLKRMAADGWLTRERSADDERRLDIVITEQGRAVQHRAAAAQRSVESMTGLTPTELIDLRDSLDELLARLNAPSHERA